MNRENFRKSPNDIEIFAYKDIVYPRLIEESQAYYVSSLEDELYVVKSDRYGNVEVVCREDIWGPDSDGKKFLEETLSKIKHVEMCVKDDEFYKITTPATSEIKEKLARMSYKEFCQDINKSMTPVTVYIPEVNTVSAPLQQEVSEHYFGVKAHSENSPIVLTVNQMFAFMRGRLIKTLSENFRESEDSMSVTFTKTDIRAILRNAEQEAYEKWDLAGDDKASKVFRNMIKEYIDTFIENVVFSEYEHAVKLQAGTHEL